MCCLHSNLFESNTMIKTPHILSYSGSNAGKYGPEYNAEYGHFSRSGLLFSFEDLSNFSI